MDDFNIISLRESRNEWCMRLVNILTPKISEGLMSIFISARKLCMDNNEPEKYLLTFQNLLTRIPQWNPEIIKEETNRILTTGNCKYLEDLITCVHIIQLKILTYVRVGTKHKKIDLNIPKLNDFIHKIYILIARVIYQKAYLYSLEINSLERQKNNAVIETIIQDSIMNAIRDSIPYELIVRSYLDETDEICEDIKEEIIKEKMPSTIQSIPTNKQLYNTTPKIYQSTLSDASVVVPDAKSLLGGSSSSVNDVSLNLIHPESAIVNNNNLPDTPLVPYDKLNNILNENLLSTSPIMPSTPPVSPISPSIFNTPVINKDVSFVDDMDLTLCEIPSKVPEVSSTPTLDYIELE